MEQNLQNLQNNEMAREARQPAASIGELVDEPMM